MRVHQRDRDVERLAGRDAVDRQRDLVARLLILLDVVDLVHSRGRGAVDRGDHVAHLQALAGRGGARIDRVDLHARDAAVIGLDIAARDADGRAAGHIAVGDQLVNDLLGRVDRDSEAHALDGRIAVHAARQLGGRDADHLTVLVDQRAARVARVDGRVGLDQGHDAVVDGHIAVDGRDAAAGDRVGELHAAGRADGIGIFAGLQLVGIAELRGGQLALGRDLDDREVGLLIRADDLGIQLGAVAQLDGHALRAVHHMVVGDDIAVRAHDDARTAAHAARRGREDGHDRRADLFIDLLARQAVDHVVIVRVQLGRVVDLHGRLAAGLRALAAVRRRAAAGKQVADRRAACKQQAGRRDAAHADQHRLAVLFLRPLRVLGRLRLCAARKIGLRAAVKGLLARGLIGRVLHRRLERGARLAGLFVRRLLRGGLLVCGLLRLRRLRRTGLRVVLYLVVLRRRCVAVIEVVHAVDLPIDFVPLSYRPIVVVC